MKLFLFLQSITLVLSRSPVLVAEFLNGERHWQSLNSFTCDEVKIMMVMINR